MPANYPNIAQSYTQQLQDVANPPKVSASPTQSNFSITPNGAGNGLPTDPAMAPPQTPNSQSFVATMPASVDGPADTPQTGDKRKRSKVSRACDECRRKKVIIRNICRTLTERFTLELTLILTLRRFVATLPSTKMVLQRHAQIVRKLVSLVALRENP